MDGDDPWYWFAYDDQWRIVATFRAEDADPKEVFVHHAAGLGGFGGSSYIDGVILRDRDIANAWTSDADSKRTERRYYAQNWRADVSAILTDEGSMVEWVKYSAYGVPFGLPAGDTDSDGDWDGDDKGRIGSGAYDVRKDVNLDGVEDSDDVDQGNAVTGGNHALGRGVLSAGGVGGAVGNRRGYAGYEYAPELEGTGAAGRHLYHVRNRVYDADVGRWTRRDPLGYVDGMGLYEYVNSAPLIYIDPTGLVIEMPPPPPPPAYITPAPPVEPAPSRIFIPESCPRPARGVPLKSIPARCVAVEAGTICCSTVVAGGIACCLTAWTGFEVGCWISETFVVPNMPAPPSYRPPSIRKRPRNRDDFDCSNDNLVKLLGIQKMFCSGFDNNHTEPCRYMPNATLQACEVYNDMQACIYARLAVMEWHEKCDPPPSDLNQDGKLAKTRREQHSAYLRKLSAGQRECQEKCNNYHIRKQLGPRR